MMYSNVIVGITIFCSSFVFSQSCVKVSASLINVGSLAVGAFDLVNCSLSVVRFVPVLRWSASVVTLVWACELHLSKCSD